MVYQKQVNLDLVSIYSFIEPLPLRSLTVAAIFVSFSFLTFFLSRVEFLLSICTLPLFYFKYTVIAWQRLVEQ